MEKNEGTAPPETLSGMLGLGIRAMRDLDRERYHPDATYVWPVR